MIVCINKHLYIRKVSRKLSFIFVQTQRKRVPTDDIFRSFKL